MSENAFSQIDKTIQEDNNKVSEEYKFARRKQRVIALKFIYAVDRLDYTVSLDEVVKNFNSGFNWTVEDDDYALEIASCVIEDREEYDNLIRPLLKNWRLERLGCCTKLILRMALCELKKGKIVSSIVINEAIEIAKLFTEKDAYKFINGILDEACKVYSIGKVESKKVKK